VNVCVRLLLLLTAGVLAAGLVLKVVLPLCGGPDLMGGGLTGLAQDLAHEAGRGEALGRRDREVMQGLREKHALVQELIDGRLTLAEALERFRALREHLDDGLDEVVGPHPAPRDEEGLYRTVMNWVGATLHESPRRQEVLARLEAEWQLSRGLHGPPPPREGPTIEKAAAPAEFP
jgi:hypothetical protein